MATTIREIIAIVLMAAGLFAFIVEIIGAFRFDYVLNRMHAASIGDSVGILLMAAAGALLFWDGFAIAKLICIVLFLWLNAPVSAHLIARVELLTNRHLDDHLLAEREDGAETEEK